jgi:flavin reductase (DIM6/NTAB) family NADH-FMN oxidoreductase RutF
MKKEATLRDGINAFPAFPVVLVTTRENIITVGLIHRFSYNPFMLGIGISYRRHSYQLIQSEGEFVVNIPTVHHLKQVKICGSLSGRDVDKFKETGFTKLVGKRVSSAIIEECPVSIECKVTQEVKLKERSWFIGDVVTVHADDEYDVFQALMCDRGSYILMGERVDSR